MDISPLVNNIDFGTISGSYVSLSGNPLSEQSINEYIPILQQRGIIVFWP